MSCGYKPTMAALLGAIANIDRLAAFRRDCERGFSLAMSTKSNQCHHTYGLRRRAAWNDARMLGGPARGRRHLSRAACSAPYWALLCKVRQRAIRKTLPRDDPIRKIHKVAG